MLQWNPRGYGQLTGWMASLGLVAALAGCGASEGPAPVAPESSVREVPKSSAPVALEKAMRPLPVGGGMIGGDARPAATADASPVATRLPSRVKPSPFELVGTSISGTNAYALLKEADQSQLIVHEGDSIDGYTIAAIESDRVKVRSPDNDEQLLVLLTATGNEAAPATRTHGVPAESPANSAAIAGGINTDQSIPDHVTFGPTGRLPEGMKQMGH